MPENDNPHTRRKRQAEREAQTEMEKGRDKSITCCQKSST